MPRAQRYQVERRAGAEVAVSSYSLALLELWAPLAAALLRAALLAWGSTADAVTCTAERATRVIDCMINSRRYYRAAKLPNTPDRSLVARNQTCWYCNKRLSQLDATSGNARRQNETQRHVPKTDGSRHGCTSSQKIAALTVPEAAKRQPKRRRQDVRGSSGHCTFKMMVCENVSDSDGESIDASLLDAIEHPRIERWPLDNDLTRVICAFVPRRYTQTQCISRTFRDQREALRRGEARAAIAAAVPVQLAAAIEAVLWTTETRESYGRATRRIVFALRRNDQLRRRVLDGSLTPTALAALGEEALAPPAVAQWRADDRSRLAKRVGARPSTLPEVDAFECPRCGARRAYVANATHGGSVDRAHILARCLECGRGWAP